MAAFTQLPTPVDITPVNDGSFKDVDVSAHVTNASGVLIRIHKVSSSNDDLYFRKKGSTDDKQFNSGVGKQAFCAVGIDAFNVFEMRLQTSVGAWNIDLIGYFNADDFVFFDNLQTLAPAAGVWSDWDISSLTGGDTALAAVCVAFNDSGSPRDLGYRMKGSTDDIRQKVGVDLTSGSPVVGVDGSEVFQVYRESTFVGDLFLTGYAKSGVTMNVNAVDASIATTGAWTDLPGTHDAGIFAQVISTTTDDELWGLRPDGNTNFDYYEDMQSRHAWTVVGDPSGIIEGQIETTNVDFYIYGTIDGDSAGVSIPVIMNQLRNQGII